MSHFTVIINRCELTTFLFSDNVENARSIADNGFWHDCKMEQKGGRRDQVCEMCLCYDGFEIMGFSSAGDVLCEVQTDKAVVSLEADEDGTLAKILISKDSAEVNVGSSIAIIAEAGEDWKSVKVRLFAHARIQWSLFRCLPTERRVNRNNRRSQALCRWLRRLRLRLRIMPMKCQRSKIVLSMIR
jgi:hypothetical protein